MRSLILLLALLAGPSTLGAQAVASSAEEAVVIRDSDALNDADLEALMAVLAPSLRIYKRAVEPHALVGPLSDRMGTRDQVHRYFSEAFRKPQGRHTVVDMVSLGDLVLAHVEIQLPDTAATHQMLTGFRVRDGLIDRIWHLALFENARRDSGAVSREVIRQLDEAFDRNDGAPQLALFAPDARSFHFRDAPDSFGGAGSSSGADTMASKPSGGAFTADGPVAQQWLDGFAVGEWTAALRRTTRADGTVAEGVFLYRVRNGLVTEAWCMAERILAGDGKNVSGKASSAPRAAHDMVGI